MWMYYLPNLYYPISARSPQGEGSPAAQADAVAGAVASSPSQPAKAKRRTGRRS